MTKVNSLFAKRAVALVCAGAVAVLGMFGLSACAGGASQQPTRSISVEGVEYQIPEKVDKVAPGIGALTQLTAMIAGDNPVIAAAPTAQISDKFKQVLPAYEQGNPDGNDSANIEQVIASGAQVVYAPAGLYSDEQKAQLSDAGITFVAINDLASIEGMCGATEAIGAILGGDMEAKAGEFAQFWRGNVEDAHKRVAGMDEKDKPKVLNIAYNNGAWSTEAGDSLIGTYIEAAGGVNIAKDYSAQEAQGGQGKAGAVVDEEQIVTWNPDYIITYSAEAADQIMADKALASVKAVKDGHVYTSPKGLYLWAVRSGEGALMAPWVGTKINADEFENVDMKAMVKGFFKDYYGYELSDQDADAILAGTF